MTSFARQRLARFRNTEAWFPGETGLLAITQSIFRIYYNMGDCIFCKIVAGEAKATIVYKDELVTAFRDIHPVAPTHILIVPNKHIESVGALDETDAPLAGTLLFTARILAEQEGIAKSGFRIITNTGVNGGQTVPHLHVHLIGGQHMKFPMG